jgi:hypothetical protein
LTNVINFLESIKPEGDFKSYKISEKLMLNSIVNEDDRIINNFLFSRKSYSKKVVWAHLGGKQADNIVHTAFASLPRHSEQSGDFDQLLYLIEFSESPENDTVEIDETILEKITTHKNYFQKWQAASKIKHGLLKIKKRGRNFGVN